jgi:DNA-directed RNA polymerase specialized sigma24 family protein
MKRKGLKPEQPFATAGVFATTHWSVVLAAGDENDPLAAAALGQLCQSYWYPLYAFVRRQGANPHEAEDLTQEFFARLLDKRFIANASPEKGRFRSFLLVALKRFLINERERALAQKRGGGQPTIPINVEQAEAGYRADPVDEMTADRVYERRWVLALLDHVIEALRLEAEADGEGELFGVLKAFLCGEKGGESQASIGRRF